VNVLFSGGLTDFTSDPRCYFDKESERAKQGDAIVALIGCRK
jgi:hypothetical protein